MLVHTAPMTVGETIKLFREAQGWTQGEMARAIGGDQSRISDYELHKRRVPSAMFPAIARVTGITTDELFAAERAQWGAEPLPTEIKRIDPAPITGGTLPIRITTSVVGGGFRIMNHSTTAGTRSVPAPLLDAARPYAVRMHGDSFAPRIKNGELCYIDPDRVARVGNAVVVQRKEDALCHIVELVAIPGDAWTFCPSDPSKAFSLPPEEVEFVHVIVTVDLV